MSDKLMQFMDIMAWMTLFIFIIRIVVIPISLRNFLNKTPYLFERELAQNEAANRFYWSIIIAVICSIWLYL